MQSLTNVPVFRFSRFSWPYNHIGTCTVPLQSQYAHTVRQRYWFSGFQGFHGLIGTVPIQYAHKGKVRWGNFIINLYLSVLQTNQLCYQINILYMSVKNEH